MFANVPRAATPSHEGRNSFQELLPYHPGNLRFPAEVSELPRAALSTGDRRLPEFPGISSAGNNSRDPRQEQPLPASPVSCSGTSRPLRATAKSRESHSLRECQLRAPSFAAKTQIRARRTRDLWTQQYLCIPAKVRGGGKNRQLFFLLETMKLLTPSFPDISVCF